MDRQEGQEEGVHDHHRAQDEQRARIPTIPLGALAIRGGDQQGRGDRSLEHQAGREVERAAGQRAGPEAGWRTSSLRQDSLMRKSRRPRRLGTL